MDSKLWMAQVPSYATGPRGAVMPFAKSAAAAVRPFDKYFGWWSLDASAGRRV
jgi:hypothetical protein